MKIIKYLMNNSGKQICADFTEYRKLNSQISNVHRNMRRAYIGMMANVGKNYGVVPPAQIFAGCVQKVWRPELDFETGMPVLREYECECPLFVPNWWPCNQVNCLYHQFNNKYFENKNIYEVLKRNKSGFWKEKFNKVR